MTITNLRHETDRGRVVAQLQAIAEASHDVVGPATTLHMSPTEATSGVLSLGSPIITGEGVWDRVPCSVNRTAFRQLAERASIPVRYLDTLVGDDQAWLSSFNLNKRAEKVGGTTLFRLLHLNEEWRLRAVLSDRYQALDNWDVFTAVASGIQAADVDLGATEIEVDWTDDRFRMRIGVPSVELLIPELLGDYRSPYGVTTTPNDPWYRPGVRPEDQRPVLFAGLEVANSETGLGAASIVPRIVVLACRNGMTRNQDVLRSVHLGSRLEQGTIDWSVETRRKAVDLLTSQISDAVRRFVSVDYLRAAVEEMRTAKATPVVNVTKAFERARQDLGLTEEETNLAVTAFMRGRDASVLGIGQAITAVAQLAEDGDRQSEVESTFWQIVAKPAVYAG